MRGVRILRISAASVASHRGNRLVSTVTADSKRRILAVNSGSSSLKVGVFGIEPELRETGSIVADGIASGSGRLRAAGSLRSIGQADADLPTHDAAIALVLDALEGQEPSGTVAAVGHRV